MSDAKKFNRFKSNFKKLVEPIEIDLATKANLSSLEKGLKGRGA